MQETHNADFVQQLQGLQQVFHSRVVVFYDTISQHEGQSVFKHQDVLQQHGGRERGPSGF